ncbi:MAG: hypothetical protein EVA89_05140, partial [Sandaracinaceae bacterium]
MTGTSTTKSFIMAALAVAIAGSAGKASAADILFVSDVDSDNNIPGVLIADGHTVTVVTYDYESVTETNPTLTGDLGGYHAVFWSATGSGTGRVHDASTISALEAYVSAGGMVFVTGYDSVASPDDPNLFAFVGGTGVRDYPPSPGPVAMIDNALTTGVVDIRGVTPTGGHTDRDALTGLAADTVAVVGSRGVATETQWSLRTLGRGLIAYVSNGESGRTSAHPSWTNTAAGGAGAYNAALRNFAFASDRANILFVSDTNSDNNLPGVLRGDGHTVTVVTNDYDPVTDTNPALVGDLSSYDAVYWSATGEGSGSLHDASTFVALEAYIADGGRVFVTGYDSLDSPDDPNLFGFVGGTGVRDGPSAPGPVAMIANTLTTGVVDIRGVTPTGGSTDRDALTGLRAGTTAVVASSGGASETQWSLRDEPARGPVGQVVYVSNGDRGPTSAHPSWDNTAAGGAGAYNAAARNFAYWAAAPLRRAPTGAANGAMCMSGSDCASGSCVDGVCCDTACGMGATDDCQACTAALTGGVDGTCAPIAAATECRASAGACDAAEVCDGASTACPADAFVAAGTECRASADLCDAAEVCDGASAACPADGFAAAGTECRASADVCDSAEVCDGSNAACPADAF